uniref:Uncharacterized protein n=1 Tax=Candidatus Kentrum sp. MB TaxID=2138164 RepID=A0A451BE91_9GAMM|nr:MAG: hypothetical protein BECKMB1821H_GA0114242_106412 [Candidatus Kentron sp. MB]
MKTIETNVHACGLSWPEGGPPEGGPISGAERFAMTEISKFRLMAVAGPHDFDKKTITDKLSRHE